MQRALELNRLDQVDELLAFVERLPPRENKRLLDREGFDRHAARNAIPSRGIEEIAVKSDVELIKEARTDPDAFAALYERHVRSLHGWFRTRTADPGVAMDLTAETFAQAALGLRRFRDLRGGTAAPWLFGIAANLLRTYYERDRVETAARRRLGLPLDRYDGAFEDADERAVAESFAPALREALDGLPAGQRKALELRVLEERSYGEVAALLGTTEGAVRLRVMRALGALSRKLKGAAL